MKKSDNLIDINKIKGFPRVYRFNQFLRWFVIIFALAAIAYSVWIIFCMLDADSSKFHKIVPFVIIFLAANSLMRNLFNVNSILFSEEKIAFRYLARKSVKIYWNSLKKMELNKSKTRAVKFLYQEEEKEKSFIFVLSFPNILEILNSIAEMCPQLEFDEFMEKVIISDKEKFRNRKNT